MRLRSLKYAASFSSKNENDVTLAVADTADQHQNELNILNENVLILLYKKFERAFVLSMF